MPRSSDKHNAKRDDGKGSAARNEEKPKRAGIAARLGSRFPNLFSAPARIMGPRLLFIASVVLLCALGLVMVYSASSIEAYDSFGDASYYFDRQVLFLGVGVVACVVLSFVPYSFWSHPWVFISLWSLACILLLLTDLMPVSALGAERSISLGAFAVQPSEFAKIAVLVAAASLISMLNREELPFKRAAAYIVVAAVVPIYLIYRQPDLGTAIILIVGLLALMILSGFSWKPIALVLCVFAAYVVIVCIVQPYHIDRIVTMFDPWLDPQGDGYQSVQSQYAFGSGGIFGVGLGLSRQKYLYLPEAHTDFIFAIIGEELGLIGTVCTVALFAVFVFAGLRISRTAPDLFGCILAGSMTVMIGFQACVNMGQACGVAPVTGKALPFVSYGGSSLIATLMMVGIIISVSRNSKVGAAHERRRDNLLVLSGKKQERTDRGAESPAAQKGKVVALWGRTHKQDESAARSRGGAAARAGSSAHERERDARTRRENRTRTGTRDSQRTSEKTREQRDSERGGKGRLDYHQRKGTRGYAVRERTVRAPSMQLHQSSAERKDGQSKSSRSASRPRRASGSSTKPANPSGTKRR